MKFEIGAIRYMGHEIQNYMRNGYTLPAAWSSFYGRLNVVPSDKLYVLYEWTDIDMAHELFEFLWLMVGNQGEDIVWPI